ncbi:MAG: hypothetical protein ACI97A_000755 [Planctomycetota bacterium]|jgi:hypothetical protein
MAKLKNELSWSRTRMATLKTCHRLYYYQYYQKWGGWGWDAPEESRQAYFFSKMTNLPMLVGHAVHETIKRLLEDLRDFGEIRVEDPGLYLRKNFLSKTWQDAEKQLWKKSVKKHPPVFELYYDRAPSPDEMKQVGANAADAIGTFLDSPFFAELQTDDKADWLAVDPEPSFDESTKLKLNGRTIWALPDFARRKDGKCEIWDWKTGRKNEHDELQLLSYALYARDTWGFGPDDIRLFGYYLKNDEIAEYPCNADRMAFIEGEIESNFEMLQGLLTDVGTNTPLEKEDAFPMIDDLSTCERCFYKQLCDR